MDHRGSKLLETVKVYNTVYNNIATELLYVYLARLLNN